MRGLCLHGHCLTRRIYYHVPRCPCASAAPLLRADAEAQYIPSMENITNYGTAGEGRVGGKQHLNVTFAEWPGQRSLSIY